MRFLSGLLIVVGIGCGTQPEHEAPAPEPARARELASADIVGEVVDGELRLTAASHPGLRVVTDLTIDTNAVAGDGPNETVELVTSNQGTGVADCDVANTFCADVTVRSFYTTQQARGLCVELSAITPATHVARGDDPSVEGLSTVLGLWCYGTLGVRGTPNSVATRRWKFATPGATSFTLRGRVVADLRPVADPIESCLGGADEDADGFTNCADAECINATACNPTETTCGDGVDDDGDGNADCKDSDCSGNAAVCYQPEACDISYVVPNGQTGNQAYGLPLGMEFDVNQDITVTHAGVFDDGSNGLAATITWRLYNRNTQALVAGPVTFSNVLPGTLVGGSRFLALSTPLVLPPGFQGVVVAEGYGAGEQNGNAGGAIASWTMNTGGGAISFVGGGRFGTVANQYPTTVDGGPANRYAAGTFTFDTVGFCSL